MSECIQVNKETTVAYPDFAKTVKTSWHDHEHYIDSIRCLGRHPLRKEYAPKLVSVVPSGTNLGYAEITIVYRYVGPVAELAFDESIEAAAVEAERATYEADNPIWWEGSGT